MYGSQLQDHSGLGQLVARQKKTKAILAHSVLAVLQTYCVCPCRAPLLLHEGTECYCLFAVNAACGESLYA